MYLFVNTDIFVLTDFSMGTAGYLLHCSLVIPPPPSRDSLTVWKAHIISEAWKCFQLQNSLGVLEKKINLSDRKARHQIDEFLFSFLYFLKIEGC